MAFAIRRLRKPRLFLCYRRKDSKDQVEHLRGALAAEFGDKRVFMDKRSIRPGTNFPSAIQTALGSADVLLAIIGRKWTTVDKRGRPRLHDPQDYVRRELETALERQIPVVPVLLDGVKMPAGKALPESLRSLIWQQAVELTTEEWESAVRDTLIPAVHVGAREYWKRPRPAEPGPAAGSVRTRLTAWLQWQLPAVSRVVRGTGEGMGHGARRVAPWLARWPTPVLRVGAAIWVLVLLAAWLTGALWLGPAMSTTPGQPVVVNAGGVFVGLLAAPGLMLMVGGIGGVMTLGMATAFEGIAAKWEGRERASVRELAVQVTFVMIGVFTLLGLGFAAASIEAIIEHQRTPAPTELRSELGFAAVGAWLLATGIGLVCCAGLRHRTIQGSRRVADQYFPLLVGVVALVAVATASWIGVVLAAGVVALCVACLAVELADRASSLPSYLGGVAMTAAAGGALVLL
jgi:TIR domain